ncbi:MAG: PKD domain-containing protein, partial [Actinomycetota bacterium]
MPIFSTTFDSGAPSEFTGVTSTELSQGFAGYGLAGRFLRNAAASPATPTTLTLTGLPPHTSVDIGFFLATIDSWDGGPCHAGPDSFNVRIDGTTRFSRVFENSFCGAQNYVVPPDVTLARHLNLGFSGPGSYYTDSVYNMGFDPIFQNIPHTGSTLTIEWFASGPVWQGWTDESWALDNVEVFLGGVTTNTAPVADAGGPYQVDEGALATLDGSASSDADVDALTYDWDLDLDGAFDDATGVGPTLSRDDGPASVTVRLRVTDPDGLSSTDEATVNVANVAPTATLSAPASVLEGGSYTISLGGSTDPSTADSAALQFAFYCGLGAGYGSFGTATF